MTDWTVPDVAFSSEAEAVKWWLKEHFTSTAEYEQGVRATELYATYADAASSVVKLPLLSGVMFGRIVGSLVPKQRAWSSEGSAVWVRYQVRPKPGVDLAPVPCGEHQPHTAEVARAIFAEARKKRVGGSSEWEMHGAKSNANLAIVVRFIDETLDRLPTLEPARKLLGIERPSNPLKTEEVAVSEIFKQFPPNGWSYIKFLDILSQATHVTRTPARKVAHLERKS